MIEVRHLQKYFGSLHAVRDVSFDVAPGQILGFLGPNGAGKSTTMKMLTGFLQPSSGVIRIWGHDVVQHPIEAQRHLGYLPEGAPCYEEMTPLTFLKFIAEVRGLVGGNAREAVARAADQMSLGDVMDQRIETLSKGFKRRVGLAQAILHDPDVLILDEPTDGLDPNQKHQVRELIRGLSREKIVIISTHILEEVTAVCNRSVIIANGSVVADCEPAELEQRSRYHEAITLRFSDQAEATSAFGSLESLAGAQSVEQKGAEIVVFPGSKGATLLTEVVKLASDENWQLSGLFQEKGRLDEVFRQITTGEVA